MVRIVSVIVLFAAPTILGVKLVAGCARSSRSNSQGTVADRRPEEPTLLEQSEEQVIGRWRVAGDTAGQGLRGTLVLQPDGTFESTMEGESGAEVSSGTFEVKADQGATD